MQAAGCVEWPVCVWEFKVFICLIFEIFVFIVMFCGFATLRSKLVCKEHVALHCLHYIIYYFVMLSCLIIIFHCERLYRAI